jgi:hypothetical protein
MNRRPEDGTLLRPRPARCQGHRPGPALRLSPARRAGHRPFGHLADRSMRDCGLWPGGDTRCVSGSARTGTSLSPGSGRISCPARGGDAFSSPCWIMAVWYRKPDRTTTGSKGKRPPAPVSPISMPSPSIWTRGMPRRAARPGPCGSVTVTRLNTKGQAIQVWTRRTCIGAPRVCPRRTSFPNSVSPRLLWPKLTPGSDRPQWRSRAGCRLGKADAKP